LVGSRSLTAERFGRDWRCPDQAFTLSSYVCAVGLTNSQAQPHWRLGGWAAMDVAIAANSANYAASTTAFTRKCWLNQLNLLILPKLVSPYTLVLQFPSWHLVMAIEVWEYTGEDIDELMRLDQIQAELYQE
jgi:hypothetical protein